MAEQRKIVTATPENSETPLHTLSSWVTPNRLFFVRNHFDVPALNHSAWRLRVEGCVQRAVEWSLDDLAALPERTVFATVECAGNGRSFLQPRAPGVQWGAGAVGHAEWTGVPVRLILERSGIRPEAVEVLFEGGDRGSEPDHPEPMLFARSLPLAKALHPDTLLATRMNGELLEPDHGAPLRLFVPGWYGVASVKWLRRIEVIDYAFQGYFQSVKYTVKRPTPRGQETVVVGPMAVKSDFIRPQPDAVLGAGTNRLVGVAWAGEEAVAAVEVSTDGGRNWRFADLIGPQAPYSWTLWEYLWEEARPGEYTLLSRARSVSGRVQPAEHDPLNGGYLIHHCRPCSVRIEAVRAIPVGPADVESLLYDMNAYAESNTRLPLDVDLEYVGGGGIDDFTMTTPREAFLQRVRQAVAEGNRPGDAAPLAPRRDVGYQGAGPDPVARFRAELLAAGGQFWPAADRAAAAATALSLVKQNGSRRVLLGAGHVLEQLGLRDRLAELGVEVTMVADLPAERSRDTFFQADLGISGVDYLVAETGSLAVLTRPDEPRSLSLLPPIHIAIAHVSQIVPDLFDLFARPDFEKGQPSCLTLITGPSKTGDIELKLVTGVHGPGELHVVLLTS